MRCAAAVVVTFVAAVASSCASEQVRWGDETQSTSPPTTVSAAPAATAEEHEKPKTAAEYAARFPTDGACEAEARRIDQKNRDLALKLLKACIDRGDFKRLNALTDAPWTPQLKDIADSKLWCARVVAARAGDVEADVRACAGAGLGVKTLEEIFTDPNKAKGSFVIFRGRVDPDTKPKKDTPLIETVLDEGEVETTATGRHVRATFGTNSIPARDAILLVKASKMAEDAGSEDGDPVAVVEVLGSFPAADKPTFN